MKKSLSAIELYKVGLYGKVKRLTSLGEHVKAQALYEDIDVLVGTMARTVPNG